MNNNWQHNRTLTDGEQFKINDLNIWDSDWTNTAEKIQLKICYTDSNTHLQFTK